MLELLISACLVSGGDCRDFSRLYDAREVSLMTCVTMGQLEVAQWQSAHPAWEVSGWRCGWHDPASASL